MSGESQVSGTSINANFPIPGQNNSSQGFRDNFAAIKAALTRTGTELTQLRQNAVFKNPVDGLAAQSNDYAYGKIAKPQLISYTETIVDLGQQSGSVYIDFNQGNLQRITAFSDFGPVFRNVPVGNQSATIKLWVTAQNPNIICYLPDNTVYGNNNTYTNENKIKFPRRGDYLLCFMSVDRGKKIFVYVLSGLVDFKDMPVVSSSGTGTGTGTNTSAGSSLNSLDITSLPIASVTEFGLVKVDGTTVGIYDGVLSVVGGIPITVPSDARLKSNVSTIENSINLVEKLRGVRFQYLQDNQPSMGVIAQELEVHIPELVVDGPDGYKRVNYGAMSGLFIESIKTLQQEILDLKQEIADLRNQKD